jgi:hypothetical protein
VPVCAKLPALWSSPGAAKRIIVDILGNGFDLTAAGQGVLFGFDGTGNPIRLSWPQRTRREQLQKGAIDTEGSNCISNRGDWVYTTYVQDAEREVLFSSLTSQRRMTVMAAISWNWNSWHSSARPALVVLALIACVFVAFAQTPQAPYALFERATLTGSGSTITAVNVPIVVSSGLTIYTNVTMQFNVDYNGNLTLLSGYPQVFAAPIVLASSFKSGKYVGPSTVANGKAIITVSGPGVTDGGATAWSLSAAAGADNCTLPSSATWYAGPMSSSPMAARLTKASVTSTAWSYGVSGSGPSSTSSTSSCGSDNYFNWGTGTLIGVSQTGNALTVASFTRSDVDRSAPVAQITYTLAP